MKEGLTNREDNRRIVAFAGPKEGVGKTTLLLNLALYWADVQKRPVLIVPLDPLARQEHNFYLNIKERTSIADLMKILGTKNITAAGNLLKGKIPMSEYGVGVLNLAVNRKEILSLSPNILVPILSKLSETFDIFLDVESSFPMQAFAFEVADYIFWVTNPIRTHLNSTITLFKDYKSMHYSLDKVEVLCNGYDLPGSIPEIEMEKFFKKLGKDILLFMPWEESVVKNTNRKKIAILESPESAFVEGLKVILNKIKETKPIGKRDWMSSVSDEEFMQSASSVWSGVGGAGKVQEGGVFGEHEQVQEEDSEQSTLWEDLKQKVHKEVIKILEVERIVVSETAQASDQVRNRVGEIIIDVLGKQENTQLSREQRERFVKELIDEILGLGPLESLMRDPTVTEIMVNAYNRIFIEQEGKLLLTKYRFRNNEQVIQVIKRIIAPLGRRIDESVPLVDARLKDGSRVNAIIPPLSVSGPTITIRRFSKKPFGPEQYFKFGTISKECMKFLEECVKLKKNIIISGGTGTGKTTFLNALSSYIPSDERIITVEDTAELKLQQTHWIALESRPPNVEGKGEVAIRDLVKNCLRMRPDRIVVGECRGSEALDMLQAMNTGHEGSLATIHANTPRDTITRLEAMCMMASAELPIWAIREMISSAVDVVVQLSRFSDGSRKVTHITEITGREENNVKMQDLFRYKQTGINKEGKVQGAFTPTGIIPSFYDDFKAKGLEVSKEIFNKENKTHAEQDKPEEKKEENKQEENKEN
jgi:pilus assembly protein CpaF